MSQKVSNSDDQQTEPTAHGYWSKQRAAAYLDVPPYTIDYLVRTGRLPFYLIAGKRRFTRPDLDAYATRNRVEKRT